MTYEYMCENCGEYFEVRASMAEKERGLRPLCPACASDNVFQVITSVNVFKRSRGGGSAPPCCGPGGTCR